MKDKTITFRVSPEEAEQLKEINFALFDSTMSDTLRGMIGREYQALLMSGVIK